MKIRLVAPREVHRAVRQVHHFPQRSKEDLNRIEDERLRKIMLKRRKARPHGHDSVLLTCGHVVTQIRKKSGPVVYRPLPCANCTRREDEMQVRYVRASLKKKRRAVKLRKQRRIVLRKSTPAPKVLRIKLRRP